MAKQKFLDLEKLQLFKTLVDTEIEAAKTEATFDCG